MVAVGVRAGNRREAPPIDRRNDRMDMFGKVGTGIDHDHFFIADQIGLGPEIGEGRRIARQQPGDPGLERLDDGVGRVHLCASATNGDGGLVGQAAFAS